MKQHIRTAAAGLPPRTIITIHGNRISATADRTTTTRIIQIRFVVCGILHRPLYGRFLIKAVIHFIKSIEGNYVQYELFAENEGPETIDTDTADEITIEDIFEAYYDCRKHKRNRSGALQFEVDLEKNLVELWHDINNGTWLPRPSTVFIVDKPVKREIFAAAFRDRIIHHLVIKRLNPLFEKYFIYDSYSCRRGKGTHFGINRTAKFIRRGSHNNSVPAWILKIDIRGYFMNINRTILYKHLVLFIDERYHGSDKSRIKELCGSIIFNDPVQNCIRHSPYDAWNGLPKDKSLFFTNKDCGLPIGNLTSQIFANFYLTEFDHFLKKQCGIAYYGRYVDDCIIVHTSRPYLKSLVRQIQMYLRTNLGLCLHPKKIYLQPVRNGVRFLGCFIKPTHIVVNHRTINNFKERMKKYNILAVDHKPNTVERGAFISSVNSYLGILKHYKTFKIRGLVLHKFISSLWYKHTTICAGYKKISAQGGR
jgi:retron-type reverse transcriptase